MAVSKKSLQRLRVLEMIDDASLGGGQVHVLLLAKYLRGDDFEVAIATEATGWLVEKAQILEIQTYPIAISNKLTILSDYLSDFKISKI